MKSVAGANANYVGACALRLQSTARDKYLPFIEEEFPELASRYRASYARSSNVGEKYRTGLRARFASVCAAHGIRFGRDDDEASAEEEDPALDHQLGLAV